MCQAPQYVAEELLRGEGFTEVEYVRKEGPYDIADALASGEVDINLHFSARLIRRLDRGEPITTVAGVHLGCYELFTAQPRHVVDLRANIKRPSRFIITAPIRRRALFPGGSLVLTRCGVVTGAASLDSTRSSACRTEVKGMSTGAERSRLVGNARGADAPGAFGVLA
jgi:hypothetical protein